MDLELLVRARIAELDREVINAQRSQAIRRFLSTPTAAPITGGALLVPAATAWVPTSEARDPAA